MGWNDPSPTWLKQKIYFFCLLEDEGGLDQSHQSLGVPPSVTNLLCFYHWEVRARSNLSANSFLKMYLCIYIIVDTHTLGNGHMLTSASLQYSLDCGFFSSCCSKKRAIFQVYTKCHSISFPNIISQREGSLALFPISKVNTQIYIPFSHSLP